MIEATVFPDAEASIVAALQPQLAGVLVTNETPSSVSGDVVVVGYESGDPRDWGEAVATVGVDVYADTDEDCRGLTLAVQDHLAAISDDLIQGIAVPAGGAAVVVGERPPHHRRFSATATLRAQSLL